MVSHAASCKVRLTDHCLAGARNFPGKSISVCFASLPGDPLNFLNLSFVPSATVKAKCRSSAPLLAGSVGAAVADE